jgi:hypothetical protein
MNALNISVSYFKNCMDVKHPATVNLLTFLRSEKHRQAVETVRAEPDKTRRDDLKKRLLPGITPSGTFSERDENHLVNHSGLIALDIDFKENPYKPETIKQQVAKLANVAYCGLSASGRGLWVLVPIADPDRHKDHYQAITQDFARFGIRLDPAPANPASFRFYSYDPAAFFNFDAVPYWKLPTPEPVHHAPTWTSTTDSDTARRAAQFLIETRAAVAFGYNDYQRIAAACHFEFGTDGEGIAWDILENSPAFQVSNFKKHFAQHWRSFKRNAGGVCTGGTLVYLAKEKGFEPKADRMPPPAHRVAQPTPPALPPGHRRERYTDQNTGQSFDVLLNDEGYPAAWDLPDDQRESLARVIRINPAVTELIARFDMKLEGVQPMTDEGERDWQQAKARAQQIVSRAASVQQYQEQKRQIEARRR